jgi:hypothetical protein
MVTTTGPTGRVQQAETFRHQPGGQIRALDEAKAAINMLSPLLLDSKGQTIDVSVSIRLQILYCINSTSLRASYL